MPQPQRTRHFVAVHPRQADVDQGDLRPETKSVLQAAAPICSCVDAVALGLEQLDEGATRILVVFYDEHGASLGRLLRAAFNFGVDAR